MDYIFSTTGELVECDTLDEAIRRFRDLYAFSPDVSAEMISEDTVFLLRDYEIAMGI